VASDCHVRASTASVTSSPIIRFNTDETFGKFDIPMSDVFPTYAPDAYAALVGQTRDAFARQMELGVMRRDDPAMLAEHFAILLRRAVIVSAYKGNRKREHTLRLSVGSWPRR